MGINREVYQREEKKQDQEHFKGLNRKELLGELDRKKLLEELDMKDTYLTRITEETTKS